MNPWLIAAVAAGIWAAMREDEPTAPIVIKPIGKVPVPTTGPRG